MSDGYVQKFTAENVASATSIGVSCPGLTAGNHLWAPFGYSNNLGTGGEGVSGGGNTFTLIGSTNDVSSGNFHYSFEAPNYVGTSFTVTAAWTNSNPVRHICVVDSSGRDTGTRDGHSENVDAAPGAGADAITTGAGTASAAGQCLAASVASGVGVSAPTSGTTFTDRGTIWTTSTLPGRLESKSTSAGSVTGTFTRTNAEAHSSLEVLLKDAQGPAVTITLMGAMCQ